MLVRTWQQRQGPAALTVLIPQSTKLHSYTMWELPMILKYKVGFKNIDAALVKTASAW